MKTALLVGGLPIANQLHRLKKGVQVKISREQGRSEEEVKTCFNFFHCRRSWLPHRPDSLTSSQTMVWSDSLQLLSNLRWFVLKQQMK